MIGLRIALRSKPGKMTEVVQTLDSLSSVVRTQWGCLGFTFRLDHEGQTIEVLQSWSDQAALDAYLGSREHHALVGAMETLCEEHSLSTTTAGTPE
jgi:quinol monooxygenase YgiN